MRNFHEFMDKANYLLQLLFILLVFGNGSREQFHLHLSRAMRETPLQFIAFFINGT